MDNKDVEEDFAQIYRDNQGRQVLTYVDLGDPCEIHIMFNTGWALVDCKLGYNDPDLALRDFRKAPEQGVLERVSYMREQLE